MNLDIRLSLEGPQGGLGPGWVLPFIDDTGSDYMCIYDNNIRDMQNYYTNNRLAGTAPLMSPTYVSLANGDRIHCVVRSMWDNINNPGTGNQMTSTTCIPTICWYHDRNAAHAPKRLNGPWLRSKLYTASAPSGTPNLWIFNNKSGFNERVPSIPFTHRNNFTKLPTRYA